MEADSTDPENILTAIVGSWRIISSTGMDKYLRKWKRSELEHAFFRSASKHFECEKDSSTFSVFDTIGTLINSKINLKIGETNDENFVENNMLVSSISRGDEIIRQERFVKNGNLHLVMKKYGLICTRVYEKIEAKAQVFSGAADDLEQKVEALTLEVVKLKKDLKKKSKEVDAVNNQLIVEKKKYSEENNAMAFQLLRVKDELKDKDKEASAVKSELSTVKAELKRLGNEFNCKSEEVTALNDQISKYKEEYSAETTRLALELSTLQTEMLLLKEKNAIVTETPNFNRKAFLGHWELQNPTHRAPFVPEKLHFSMEDGELVERNTGSIDEKYICYEDPVIGYTWNDGRGVRTYFDQTQKKLISESVFENGELCYCLKRCVEGDVLKVTAIASEGEQIEFVYMKKEI